MVVENCIIKSKKVYENNIYDIDVFCPEIAKSAVCGQFVDVKCSDLTLRRPISICDIDSKCEKIRLVFQVRGEGTDWLSKKEVGETLSLLGPLGNGFNISGEKTAVFIGGGIGVPPLLNAAKKHGNDSFAILGFRNKDSIILKNEFEEACKKVIICTDDGTAGFHGVVTEPFIKLIEKEEIKTVYACGPRPMLKAISVICLQNGIDCFVSMEERMACGVGACLCCAIKVMVDGEEKYLHVCKNGPIFDSKTIVW